ncbi:MAG TPA: OmpH family outer membrane protein, partial [Tepidisphaeraceae bacterium]
GEQTKLQQEAKERIEKLNAVKTQRDQLKPDAPQWADLNKQFVQLRSEAQAWEEQTKGELSRKFRDQAKKMNDKITSAIDEVAKAKQIDLVIAEQKPEVNDQQMDQLNPQQIMNVLFASRNVLYKNEALDLTPEVIAKLDATYTPGK